jgi:MFS family permease
MPFSVWQQSEREEDQVGTDTEKPEGARGQAGKQSFKRRREIIWCIIASRAIYAINWLNIGTIFSVMAPEFSQGTVGLGALTSSFYIGVGVMQIPAGVVAGRWGSKKTLIAGTMLASVSALATGLVPSFEDAVVLRFFVGAGMAFAFGPGLVLLTRFIGRETSGTGAGMINSAFGLGGFFAFFVWGVLAADLGWRVSLVFSGALGIFIGAALIVVIPPDEARGEFRIRLGGLRRVIMNRDTIALGLGLLGVAIGTTLVQSFMFYYLNHTLGFGAGESGLTTSLIVVAPILSSPLIGARLYDRLRRPRLIMLAAVIGIAGSLAVAAAGNIVAAILCSVLGGLISGVGYTTGFAYARDLDVGGGREYDTLAIAWVNCISLIGSFFPPLVFAYVVGGAGYPVAWLTGAALVLAFGLPVLLLRETFRVTAEPR